MDISHTVLVEFTSGVTNVPRATASEVLPVCTSRALNGLVDLAAMGAHCVFNAKYFHSKAGSQRAHGLLIMFPSFRVEQDSKYLLKTIYLDFKMISMEH